MNTNYTHRPIQNNSHQVYYTDGDYHQLGTSSYGYQSTSYTVSTASTSINERYVTNSPEYSYTIGPPIMPSSYSKAPTMRSVSPLIRSSYKLVSAASSVEDNLAKVLLVSPGQPTPIALCSYDNKQPTGLIHVTRGNQTVEFLDGVANMPMARG